MIEGVVKFFRDGGPIMYPLLLCSLVALTFVIERCILHIRKGVSRDRDGLLDVLDMIRRGERPKARVRAEGSGDPLLRAVGESLGEDHRGGRGILEMAYAEEERRLNRYMAVLDTIITLAPLLGILGTVLGMIQAFNVIAFQTAVVKPILLAGGVSKAMVTTAGGLIVAIPAMLFSGFAKNRAIASW